ncbi:hypothetical protein F0562_007460 [Nyssa sinensis]|uniref:WRKY domain-containing protein n=1 Tax=Nyssa sinensis TaxID=561372 RepID=A0A5J5A3F3_9ASTE|nr:hypothetical protein F0562_007460 [Nyssa sinensis]
MIEVRQRKQDDCFSILNRESEYGGDFPHLQSKLPVKQEVNVLVEELDRATSENKRLTDMLTILCQKYNNLQNHLTDLTNKSSDNELARFGKRKAEHENRSTIVRIDGNTASSSIDEGSSKKPKECINSISTSRIYVRTDPSDTSLIVKDGHQWRKYGQKVTRYNSSPRAYYKCSCAPTCPVKKKVQRSVEDPSILVATYEGQHNHRRPFQAELSLSLKPGSASMIPPATFDLVEPKLYSIAKNTTPNPEGSALQRLLVDQMASSLTRDPSFARALTAAISGRILEPNQMEK